MALGITNNDGTECYINSSIQCILSIPELKKYMIENYGGIIKWEPGNLQESGQDNMHESGQDNIQVKILALKYFASLVKKMADSTNPNKLINPLHLKALVKLHMGDNSTIFFGQQCAYEFIKKLLDWFGTALQSVNSPTLKNRFGEKITIIKDLFGGKIVNFIGCTNCNNVISDTVNADLLEISSGIDLTQGDQSTVNDVQTAISEYFTCEKVGDFRCSGCGPNGTALKLARVTQAPKYMFVCLKRYTNKLKKIQQQIIINKIISITEFIDPTDSEYTIKKYYDLICDIIHVGSYSGGHYYSIVQDIPTGKWYFQNDLSSKEIETPDGFLDPQNSYLLLYHLRN